jgi:hypothetical protein
MTLGERQRHFPLMVAALVTWAYEQGFEITFGEAYRTPEQAAFNAKSGCRHRELAPHAAPRDRS